MGWLGFSILFWLAAWGVNVALARLASDARPFLLLVESEEVDSASHVGDLERLLRGMEAIEATMTLVLDFADECRFWVALKPSVA